MGRITEAFATTWRVRGLPSFIADDSLAMLDDLTAAMVKGFERLVIDHDAIGRLTTTARFDAAYVQLPPVEVAIGIEKAIAAIATDVLVEPYFAIAMMAALSLWSTSLPPIPTHTPTRRRQLANRAALTALARRSAALGAAKRLLNVRDIQRRGARDLRDFLATMFAPIVADASTANDGSSRALRNVANAVTTLLTARIGPVNTLAVFTTPVTLPLHVAAHRIYQDARESGRLLAANPIPHPTFMPTELVAPEVV